MCAHYKRQLLELAIVLDKKQRQFTVLEREHESLQSKEKALFQAIQGFEGPLALTRHALESAAAPAAAADAAAAAAATVGGPGGSSGSASPDIFMSDSICGIQQQQQQGSLQGPCSSGGSSGGGAGSGTSLPRVPYTHPQTLLQHLDARERGVQSVLQQLGGCGGEAAAYTQLYTSQLLQKSMADPDRAAGFLAVPPLERLTYLAEACTRMALLLGKYDADVRMGGPCMSRGSSGSNGGGYSGSNASSIKPGMTFRQALDSEVDELFERKVVCGLWDPNSTHLQIYMTNLQTKELEAYPQGWWEHVAQSLHPTKQQLAAIKLVWGRVKQQAADLAAEYEQLQQQLQQSYRQRRDANLNFERVVQQLCAMDLGRYGGVRSTQQQQQQQQQEEESMKVTPPLQQLHDLWASEGQQPPQQPPRPPQQPPQLPQLPQPPHPSQLSQQQGSSSSGLMGPNAGCLFAPGAGAQSGQLQEAEEVLLQEGETEKALQRQMAAVTNKIRVLFYCLMLQLANTFTKKQLAVMVVQSHPFMFDSLCVCETMEKLGWLD